MTLPMTARSKRSWLTIAACLGLALRARTHGQLADASPFLTPGAADNPAAAAGADALELRGIMSTSAGYLYCIYDPARKSSTWVGINEGGHDFVVRSAEPDRDAVTVQSAGRTFSIALHESKVATMSGPVLTMPNRGIGFQNGFPGMNSVDAARRLEAVAAEVRRRRQLREQADQAEGGMGAPNPSPQP
jgi:hypothetical protein